MRRSGFLSLVACGSGIPNKPDATLDATNGIDSSDTDTGLQDASDDAESGFDAGPASYNDITNGINWQSFADPSKMGGFASAAFDGKYIYYSPFYGINGSYVHGRAARYDTTGTFQSALSWSAFDMTQLNSKAKGYWGSVFDGRYIYYAPLISDSGPVVNTLVMRFDSKQSFTAVGAWTLFDVAPLDPHAGGYAGVTFDGRYIYFAPYIMTQAAASIALRYDTQSPFSSAGSWQTFDTLTKNPMANTYIGMAFDGRYVYYAPNGGLALRFDSQGSFKDGNAWSTMNLTAVVNPAASNFIGVVFDGRYMYYVPWQLGTGGVVARYDTQGLFNAKAAWSTFDLGNWKMGAVGFQGGVFDGRYVHFIPANNGSLIVRYDTQATFTSAASYTSFDLAAYLKMNVAQYVGGAFDGEFLYLVPASFGMPMLRFDAKTPPSLPGTAHGSFF